MIYFDNAASTPLDPLVLEAMMPYLQDHHGNASSVHSAGREARVAVERAREKVAQTLNADPKEVLFTSGATESVNTAMKGAAFAARPKKNHLILSSIEHHCALDCAHWLSHEGFQVTRVGCDAEGRVDPKEVARAMRKETFMVSIMAANNEVGTIQPFAEIGALCREKGVLFHTDAVQAYGKTPIDVQKDHIDFLSVSAHKIYGPKGVGFLYQRKGVEMVPLLHGGGQERDRRGGTENVAGIVGLGTAARMICTDKQEAERLRTLAQMFLDNLQGLIPDLVLNGPKDPASRVPGLLNLTLPGIEGETLVHSLDTHGFAASSGAACAAGASIQSHVLLAMGRTPRQALEGLRLSFGRRTEGGQVQKLLEALPVIVKNLKAMSSFLEDEDVRPRRSK